MREQEKYRESSALKISIVTKYSLVNEKVVSREGFSGGAGGKESTCQSRRWGFNPWVGKIPWRRARQPTPVFLPGELHGQRSWQATVHGISKSEHTLFQWLSPPPHTHTPRRNKTSGIYHPCDKYLLSIHYSRHWRNSNKQTPQKPL